MAAAVQNGLWTRCTNALRNLPLDSGIHFPWTFLVERLSLDKGSLVLPIFDFSEDNIQQTAGRVIYVLMLMDPFCKLAALCNGVLGSTHFVWCVCNIRRFHAQELDRKEFEKAIIRLSTAVYDVAVVFLLSRYCPGSGYLKGLLLLTIALSPQQFTQFHQAIFSLQEKPKQATAADAAKEESKEEGKLAAEPAKEKDYYHLREDCLIQVFAQGCTDAWLPPQPQSTWKDRFMSLPSGLTSYAGSVYQSFAAKVFMRAQGAAK
ncbi:MAG: hypothetical protein JSS10_07860 [Verrucomicrobia bacterium]|nr:hypothetical protein [Verrucomicrobiota bacterium]